MHDAWGKGGVRIGRGALAVERSLLAELCAELDDATRDPARLAKPLRVVVPSRSLRDHLSERLVAEAGRPLLGIRVQTLYATALEILGDAEPQGELLFPIFVERAARREETLRASLGELENGFGVVSASVSDLLDAGLEPGLNLEGLGERTAALVRVALDVQREMRGAGLSRTGDVLCSAARKLASVGPRALPSRGLAIHGFADATGRALDLLEALMRTCDARLFVDEPPRPGAPRESDAGVVFTRRLRKRLGGTTVSAREEPPPALALLSAPGAQAECRAVASRVRSLLDERGDGGVAPERIGIVARTLAPYTTKLRAQLTRLGIPFSGCSHPGPVLPEGRRLRGVVELLLRGAELPVDRWLDLLGGARELSVGLHALGAGRLGDVARLDVTRALAGHPSLALPVRRGIDAGDEGPRASRRRISAERLQGAVARSAALLERLERWRRETRPPAHVRELRALAGELAPAAALEALVDDLERSLPENVELSLAEFARVASERVTIVAASAFGGEGAGVQVLDVTEARGRSFEHLFVVGLERDVFPRNIAEDPLLRDAQRQPLEALLQDLPFKRLGHAEESYLFAQLLSSSPHVTLSWQRVDDDGRPRARSPFVVRLREHPVTELPSLWEPDGDSPLRTPLEHAALAGLHGSRGEFGRVLHAALPDEIAHARLSVLDEVDPDSGRASGLGPYFGFLGNGAIDDGGRIFVTRLEDVARCPWQAFLRKVLRIEPLPDALDGLPAIDARMLGNLVHSVLERIATPEKPAGEVAWPEPDVLEPLLRETARQVLRESGIGLAAFELLLIERARPFLASAHARIWRGTESVALAGTEVEGEYRLASGRTLGFRADLVLTDPRDRRGPCLIDVKTGATISQAKKPATRTARFAAEIASGKRLQGPLYQLGGGPGAIGRYVFLDPRISDEHAEFSVGPDDRLFVDAAVHTMDVILDAWDAGSLFPRLVDARGVEPEACKFCEVAEACLRGDSGARARLAHGIQREGDASLLALWHLAEGNGA